ncbi:MAG: hypothetical protein QXL17_07650 [Candidatus Thermoplasmatota archaeon]
MSVTNEIIFLAEGEKLIREYHVGKVRFPAKMDAYLSVTNKRVALLTKGGILRKSYSTNEVHIDDVSGVDIMTAPRNILMVIAGVVVLAIGLLLMFANLTDLIYLLFDLIFLTAGAVIIKLYLSNRFLFIVNSKATKPAFAMASPFMVRKGVRNGFGVFIGKSGPETFKLAQEIGAVILDVREKGDTKVGESAIYTSAHS